MPRKLLIAIPCLLMVLSSCGSVKESAPTDEIANPTETIVEQSVPEEISESEDIEPTESKINSTADYNNYSELEKTLRRISNSVE